jgi:NAD(P)-dependent dehydrogenase (short-subunit alcohol dehydrogenase family)
VRCGPLDQRINELGRANAGAEANLIDNVKAKVAVVTGAASGVGLAAARALASAGASVVMLDVLEGPLHDAIAEFTDSGRLCSRFPRISRVLRPWSRRHACQRTPSGRLIS